MKSIIAVFILNYLKFFAKLAIVFHKPYTIGIAGSVGKSSTRNAIYAILSEYYPTLKVEGNSETGIPLGILGFKISNYRIYDWIKVCFISPFRIFNLLKFKYLIVEMGIDNPDPPKNMEYLLTIIKPDTAISLNVSATHTMQFEKLLGDKPKDVDDLDFLLEKIAKEDTKIISDSNCKIAIYNADDKWISDEVKKSNVNAKIKTFSKDKSHSISLSSYKVSLKGTNFIFSTKNGSLCLNFDNTVLPLAYSEVFAAAILACEDILNSNDKIKTALEKNYKLPFGRSSILSGINNSVIIDSSYNASKASVIEFINLLKDLKEQTKKPVVFVFGDMRELGTQDKAQHLEITKILHGIDYLYCVGELTKKYIIPNASNYKFKEMKWFENSIDAGKHLEKNLPHNSIILVKGSQNTIFLEEAIKYILKNKTDEKKLCRQSASWLKIKGIN